MNRTESLEILPVHCSKSIAKFEVIQIPSLLYHNVCGHNDINTYNINGHQD